ncbi:MAG: S8 family peptidase [Rhodothermales bacterium]|nr:S8 family peptidase [Rhodothermales bacterium]MBO6779549.1 S8 family peptidase [Rhodothermales bacterium]
MRLFRLLSALVPTLAILTVSTPAQSQTIGGSLQDALSLAAPLDRLEVIVTFEGDAPLSATQVSALQSVGVTGLLFRSLPIAGVLATPAQVQQLAALPGLRSLWLNEELRWENDGPTAVTGVDRLRNDANFRNRLGLPFSGAGVGVLVNDSGIDALHPDLRDNVVQNVAGQTNLRGLNALLPVTYVEDIPNTDNGGGHGTHVAGIVAGTGAASGGKFEGVAPGANLIGYGSGAVVLILDAIGGFDYALTHQFEYNIRVVSNSFGESDDNGTDFQPDHPTNVATKRLADRGMIVVFSAGNSGSGAGTITGNYKKAPWVVTVAAGDNQGRLGDFSSRGRVGVTGSYIDPRDGQEYVWSDAPTVTAPGVSVVSANASTGSLYFSLHPEFAPYYSVATGTSMACPHVAGIVALMLEADPTLDWRDVKDILARTATNLPARTEWEAGAGFVNAYTAVQETLRRQSGDGVPFGSSVNLFREFNSQASLYPAQPAVSFSLQFSPVGTSESATFEVDGETDLVSASAVIGDNTAALVLSAPDGSEFVSAVSVPAYQQSITVTAPASPGTWTISVRGVRSWVGLRLDMLGISNGIGTASTIRGQIALLGTTFAGLDDIHGSPEEALVTYAVARRLVDGTSEAHFLPDEELRRSNLADYLIMGAGVRQSLPRDGRSSFQDLPVLDPFAEAVAARGAALRDLHGTQHGVMRLTNGEYLPEQRVRRFELAYSLIQSLGLQPEAEQLGSGPVTASGGSEVELADWQDIPEDVRGHVQLALDLGLMAPEEAGGLFYFAPESTVTRGAYVAHAVRLSDSFLNPALPDLGFASKGGSARVVHGDEALPQAIELDQNFPNPFNPSTTIGFRLQEAGHVLLEVFDLTGRRVSELVNATVGAGQHSVPFEASRLSSGRYLYRLTAGGTVHVRSMVLVK